MKDIIPDPDRVIRTPDQQPAERVGALCCVCGNLRTVSSRSTGRRPNTHSTGDIASPEHLSAMRSHGRSMGVEPFWRCVMELKCRPCGEFTRHAYLREREHADHLEDAINRGLRELSTLLASVRSVGDVEFVSFDESAGMCMAMLEQGVVDGAWTIRVNELLPQPVLADAFLAIVRVTNGEWCADPALWQRHSSGRYITLRLAGRSLERFRAWEEFGLLGYVIPSIGITEVR